MLAVLVDEPFDNKDFIFEIKWDGYRAIAEVDKSRVELYSRNQKSFNDNYPQIVKALQKLQVKAVFDGEIVVMDQSGKSSFQLLQTYREQPQGQLRYYVFDVLQIKGRDVKRLPLLERKQLLKQLLPKSPVIKYSDHIKEKGIAFFRQATKSGLEGIIAKNLHSSYQVGRRSWDWQKVKTHLRQEVVIAGFTAPRGSRKLFGSLVLGVYNKAGQLEYVGHTGTGFSQQGIVDTFKKLKPLIQKQSAFVVVPKTNTPATWVKPQLVGEVEFTEWTKDGQMRHPAFKGLRSDKKPKQVHRELSQPHGG